jgi:hypothetical protein
MKEPMPKSTRLISSLAVSESGFVFLPTTGETFTVNEVGRAILSALQNGRTEEEIVQLVAAEFDSDPTSIARDLHDFVSQLRHYRLLANGE